MATEAQVNSLKTVVSEALASIGTASAVYSQQVGVRNKQYTDAEISRLRVEISGVPDLAGFIAKVKEMDAALDGDDAAGLGIWNQTIQRVLDLETATQTNKDDIVATNLAVNVATQAISGLTTTVNENLAALTAAIAEGDAAVKLVVQGWVDAVDSRVNALQSAFDAHVVAQAAINAGLATKIATNESKIDEVGTALQDEAAARLASDEALGERLSTAESVQRTQQATLDDTFSSAQLHTVFGGMAAAYTNAMALVVPTEYTSPNSGIINVDFSTNTTAAANAAAAAPEAPIANETEAVGVVPEEELASAPLEVILPDTPPATLDVVLEEPTVAEVVAPASENVSVTLEEPVVAEVIPTTDSVTLDPIPVGDPLISIDPLTYTLTSVQGFTGSNDGVTTVVDLKGDNVDVITAADIELLPDADGVFQTHVKATGRIFSKLGEVTPTIFAVKYADTGEIAVFLSTADAIEEFGKVSSFG